MTDHAKLKAQIEEALFAGGGTMTLDDLVAAAQERRVQLWGADDAVVATEIIRYPRASIMYAFMAAGDVKGILRMQDRITDFAREEGCSAIYANGRAGWARIGRATGWNLHSLCFVKQLAKPS